MLTDIEIARAATPRNIAEIAARLDIGAGDILPYGHDKAKISRDFIAGLDGAPEGRLVLVTAINPTPAGEESVEIIAASGQRPQATWLDIVVTGRAKAAIRRSLREEDRSRFIRLGSELVRVAFEHVNRKVTDKALRTAAKALAMPGADELLARIGAAEISAQQVIGALWPDLAPSADEIDASRAVAGLQADQEFTRAPCCTPLPGERIVGITYRGKGVVIHAIDCPVLAGFEDQPERWVDLRWREGRHPAVYSSRLNLTIRHDAGVLGRICTLIGAQGANISDLEFLDRKPDFYRLRVDVDLRDSEHLHALMTALEAESDVAQVARIRDPSAVV